MDTRLTYAYRHLFDDLFSLFCCVDPPGNMNVSKTVVHVSEGNIPEKVFCHADGRPQPTFEWRYIASTNNWIVPGNSSTQPAQPTSQQKAGGGSGNGGPSGGVVGAGSSGSGIGQTNNNQQLVLNSAVGRHQAGYYACVARNAHGNETAYTYLDVMCKCKVPRNTPTTPPP